MSAHLLDDTHSATTSLLHPLAPDERTVAAVTRMAKVLIPYLPLIFFELYLLGSLLAFLFVPLEDFRIDNRTELMLFALSGQVAILVGYLFGARRQTANFIERVSRSRVIQVVILVSLAIFAAALVWRSNSQIPFWTALTNPGEAYRERVHALTTRTSAPLFSIIRALLGPFLALFLPVGVMYRRQLSRPWQAAWALGFGFLLVGCLLTGAAKGLFDIVLVLPWLIGAFWMSKHAAFSPHQRATKWGNAIFDVALVLGVTVFAMQYFNVSRQSRYGLKGNEYPPGTTNWLDKAKVPETPPPPASPPSPPPAPEKPVEMAAKASVKAAVTPQLALSPAMQYKIYMFVKYWSGGYKGLAQCLELPYSCCYGVGHSYFLMDYAGRLFNDPSIFRQQCYPARLEAKTGYSATGLWHTIYPWLASDLTFPGALVFIGFMGYLLGLSWCETLSGANPFAIGFFSQVLLMFYYIPCNNIRLGFSEEAISFWALLFLWIATRQRSAAAYRVFNFHSRVAQHA